MTDHQPVTTAEIASLLTRLRTLRTPAQGGDPTAYATALTAKADLLTRIADTHPDDEPARQVAAHARAAARALTDTTDTNPENIR
jgi:hypothetical protein